MGTNNNDLIRAAEKIRKQHGPFSRELETALFRIDSSQEVCKHERLARTPARMNNSLTHVGDAIQWCLDCSKALQVNGVSVVEIRKQHSH